MLLFTLSEFCSLIKDTLTNSLPDSYWVSAEIARININQKGHCYLELVEKKEDAPDPVARMNANIWAYNFRILSSKFESVAQESLKPGMRVLLLITLQFHEVYGLSLNVQDIDPTFSLGEMARKKKEVIDQLTAEGLMDLNKALPLPLVPQRVAVISSPTAAGYEDFMNHLEGNPYGYAFTTHLFSALMQGEKAEASIISALTDVQAESYFFDVAVIIRGGGAQVDLSCFDSYTLASRIARCPLPVISGIGHERDDTVADMVAHTRLKTPTAVAEFIISGVRGFEERVNGLQGRLITSAERMVRDRKHALTMQGKTLRHGGQAYLNNKRQSLGALALNLRYKPVEILTAHLHGLEVTLSRIKSKTERLIVDPLNRLETLRKGLKVITEQTFRSQDYRLQNMGNALRLLDPLNILKRGYSITSLNGKAVRNIEGISKGDRIRTRLHKGIIDSTVNLVRDSKND
jgi:exodeoxyribonuclease VII large subunit